MDIGSLVRRLDPDNPVRIAARSLRRLFGTALGARTATGSGPEIDWAHEVGKRDTRIRTNRYFAVKHEWQLRALQQEHFGPANKPPVPPKEIPPGLLHGYTMQGKATIEYSYGDMTYPANWPLIYTDEEIDSYISIISENLKRPEAERKDHWYIYGTLDQWICDALVKYPIKGKSVVNIGSMTPWYESMFILFWRSPGDHRLQSHHASDQPNAVHDDRGVGAGASGLRCRFLNFVF